MHTNSDSLNNEVIILLSGGIDSASCVQFYVDLGRKPCALFVNYKQPAYKQESLASKNIARFYNIPHMEISIDHSKSFATGEIVGRNSLLATLALVYKPHSANVIAMGIHAYTSYSDCTINFQNGIQSIFDLYSANKIHFTAPFIEWSKKEIWKFAKENNVPLEATYSCEAGGSMPCGKCLSCKDLIELKLHA